MAARFPRRRLLGLLLTTGIGMGCGGEPASAPASISETPSKDGPKLVLTKTRLADWCGEHGVPESVCTRCNASLIAGFKEKADWCEKHGLPQSQCVTCDPSVEAKWKAMAPNK